MSPAVGGLAQSIQTRLLNHARAIGADSNSVLARYGLERFLYRLGRSPHADRFVLKGGMLLRVWLGRPPGPHVMRTFWGMATSRRPNSSASFGRSAVSRSSPMA
jgi:hypothetical protein